MQTSSNPAVQECPVGLFAILLGSETVIRDQYGRPQLIQKDQYGRPYGIDRKPCFVTLASWSFGGKPVSVPTFDTNQIQAAIIAAVNAGTISTQAQFQAFRFSSDVNLKESKLQEEINCLKQENMKLKKELDTKQSIVSDLVCPITQEMMQDPVVAADDHTYERSEIVRWFERSQTSPLTREKLEDKTLRDNIMIRKQIREFQEQEKSKEESLKKEVQSLGTQRKNKMVPVRDGLPPGI